MKKFKFKHQIDGSDTIFVEGENTKALANEHYNFLFNKTTGYFCRWGETENEDADPKLGLPELVDIEISTICSGVNGVCKFCYKSNTPDGKYMSLETFKKVLWHLPPTVTQIAFGTGSIDSNPDMWLIFELCRKCGIVPNVTINGAGMTAEYYDKLAELCGAVACSNYNEDTTFNAVKELTDRGMTQVNIHNLLSEETYDKSLRLLFSKLNDKRLEKLNAIVFLSLKKKGRAEKKSYTQLSQEKFNNLVEFAMNNDISLGFDSCTAPKYLKSIENHPNLEQYKTMVEPCESCVYSSYINVDGNYFPCSFIEGTSGWETGLSVSECESFFDDIWYHEKTNNFREKVIDCRNNCKACPVYEI
jgi:MoaA/NifB/PqqE/SkfB family radical SAM enzyme